MHIITTKKNIRRLAQVGAGLALSAGVLGLAGVASADPGATGTIPAAGVGFPCTVGNNNVVFTTTGGTIHMVNQMHQDANGIWHFTGTISLQNVTASDGDGNTYSIEGASWYGATAPLPRPPPPAPPTTSTSSVPKARLLRSTRR